MHPSKAWLAAIVLAWPGHAAAQAEAKQFDFLLGQWQLEVKPKVSGMAAAIHGAPRLAGTWKAWRALDSLAVEDELRIVDASGNPISLSHALRIWSKNEGRWKVSGLDAYRARFNDASGRFESGEMRLEGRGNDPEGKPVATRTRYYEIAPDRFRMRQDRSSDGGATWDEGVLEIVATRVAPAAAR